VYLLQFQYSPDGDKPPPVHPNYLDRWDANHVRMPCSRFNEYPVGNKVGTHIAYVLLKVCLEWWWCLFRIRIMTAVNNVLIRSCFIFLYWLICKMVSIEWKKGKFYEFWNIFYTLYSFQNFMSEMLINLQWSIPNNV